MIDTTSCVAAAELSPRRDFASLW